MQDQRTPKSLSLQGFNGPPQERLEAIQRQIVESGIDQKIEAEYPEVQDFPERIRANLTARVSEFIENPVADDAEMQELLSSKLDPHDPTFRALLQKARVMEGERKWVETQKAKIARLKALDERTFTEEEAIATLRMANVLSQYVEALPPPSEGGVPGEKGEKGENDIVIDWGFSPFSPFSPSTPPQKAVFPPDSILADFYDLAVTLTEGADCYVIGSILPVCAALMGQSVWLPWMSKSLHSNLFSMLAGKPGDRKTSTIDLAELIAAKCLPRAAFLPKAFSPETLFDEYDTEAGGRPDKLWMCDDANATLADWQKSSTGERNAARFLELYDCKGLSENYRRNREKGQPKETQRRFIAHTSTSIVLGATFNICTFRNQATRAGMQRRFLYYVAEGHGRVILYPPSCEDALAKLAKDFALLSFLSGPFTLSNSAHALFEAYQRANRNKINEADPLDEPFLSRLSSSPTHVLKIAMNFEACRSIYAGRDNREIQDTTLQYAIDHVEECLSAAAKLDLVARRIYIANDADVLLAKIRYDFAGLARNGSIILNRTQLTSKYASHGRRDRGINVQDIYTRLIPHLIARGEAKALPREGKPDLYAFRVEK